MAMWSPLLNLGLAGVLIVMFVRGIVVTKPHADDLRKRAEDAEKRADVLAETLKIAEKNNAEHLEQGRTFLAAIDSFRKGLTT